jgi:hypothetical protein
MNTDFYHSPAFLNAVAASTVALIGILFIVGLHPFKKNKPAVVLVEPEEPLLWAAGDYFTYVNSWIKSSDTPAKLKECMALIDDYRYKEYRVQISKADLKRNYEKLLMAYYEKELEFDSIQVVMCKN